MLIVKGVPILVDELQILEKIKLDVLEQQNREILRKIKKSGNNIQVCCPFHNNGQERNPSCGISLVPRNGYPAGMFNCFACNTKGTFDYFVALCFGQTDANWGTKWLLDNFVTGETYERPDLFNEQDYQRFDIPKKKEIKTNYVSEEELAKYRFYHPYMYKRKLTNEVIEKYDVGYQKDFVFSEDWKPTEVITFPVRDINGNCLFVSRRSIYGKNFFLPPDIEKPVYGIYELPKDCKEAVICESVINALTCVVYGVPALALFGTGDMNQVQTLNKLPIRHYILALDPDKPGNIGTYKLKRGLKNKLISKFIIPKGKDINDLSLEEFQNLQEIYL